MGCFCCRASGLEALPTMGSGSPEQVETHRVSSDWISNHVTCCSHIHFMDRERFRTAWLWNAVKDDRVHSSLLSPVALREWPVSHANRPSWKRRRVWTFGTRKTKKPREKITGPVGRRWRVMPVTHAGMKNPGRLGDGRGGAHGFLDDLHVGADSFRGDVDAAGP